MGTHWDVILGITCDRCGEFCTFEGAESKPEALKQARAEGFYIEGKTLCEKCQEGKEGECQSPT